MVVALVKVNGNFNTLSPLWLLFLLWPAPQVRYLVHGGRGQKLTLASCRGKNGFPSIYTLQICFVHEAFYSLVTFQDWPDVGNS